MRTQELGKAIRLDPAKPIRGVVVVIVVVIVVIRRGRGGRILVVRRSVVDQPVVLQQNVRGQGDPQREQQQRKDWFQASHKVS